jgi:hypothetical protein
MADTRAVAGAVRIQIGGLGGAFMISREAKAYAEATGLTRWAPYMRGRCGVLGEVDADVVVSAAGFFPPGVVRAAWEAGASLPAGEAARRYAEVCDAFGRRKLAGLPGADAYRLAGLLETVVGDAEVFGAPLFAGWRAMPAPADSLARVARFAHVLRELRGGLHLVAILSCGLTPLEAVLAGASIPIPSGEGTARYLGWPEPYAEPADDVRRRRADAEELTDILIAPAFGGLSEAEADDLVALLNKAAKVVFC